ncbi:preprotein translocase subunit YajC [Arthrobacter sp. Br18]|uniref:preprotein translocase subunit YajC n=1 Tax=Arthrobacter sp. Br18 TaxID=1312954 RepID=UPI0004B9F79D|nr:preprotein translocase subunit YajC [Arthrobacter sp. Br18]
MLANVVAQTGDATAEQPFDIFGLLLPLALAFLIFTMFRRQRKTQKQVKEMRTQMEPGTEVMTQFGLYGTILSIDQENNKAVLELSPGNTATVHTQALSKVVTQQEPVAEENAAAGSTAAGATAAGSTTVPDDASSLVAEPHRNAEMHRDAETHSEAEPRHEGEFHPEAEPTSGAAATAETPEQISDRIDRENTRNNDK